MKLIRINTASLVFSNFSYFSFHSLQISHTFLGCTSPGIFIRFVSLTLKHTMKRIFTFALLLNIMQLLLVLSCKKSSSSSDNSNSSTTTPTPTPTTTNATSSFTVNGASQGTNITLVKGASSKIYEFLMVGSSWSMGVFFSGTVTPASGSYPVEGTNSSDVPAGKAFF